MNYFLLSVVLMSTGVECGVAGYTLIRYRGRRAIWLQVVPAIVSLIAIWMVARR